MRAVPARCESAAIGGTATFAELERVRSGAPATTDHVLDETFTLLRQHTRLATVARFSNRLRDGPPIRRVRTGEAVFEESLQLTLSHDDKNWSVTDCPSFVTLRETRIPRTLTRDHNFREAGSEVLPSAVREPRSRPPPLARPRIVPDAVPSLAAYPGRSNLSRFITFVQARAKSRTNLSFASELA